jgi:N-acetylglutamate synthase-like GNAT family acetyltransferase
LVEFSVRPAKIEEFQEIRALIHEVGINPMGLDWRHFLIAVGRDDRLIGCGQIKTHKDSSKELASIAVKRDFRGQGVARAIIENLIKREPSRPLYLMCRSQLEALYIKFGFVSVPVVEDLPRYFRQIKRLERMFNIIAKPEDSLLIMRLDRG